MGKSKKPTVAGRRTFKIDGITWTVYEVNGNEVRLGNRYMAVMWVYADALAEGCVVKVVR